MATNWQTFPIEFRGGLISNLGELQQGTVAVGSATVLQNYEPSKEGGYKKVLGYSKYEPTIVPGDTTKPIQAVKAIALDKVIAVREDTSVPSQYEYFYSDGLTGWNSLGKSPVLGD